MARLAIVVPRYGAEILGGAETFARGFAEETTARGHQVTVLTTCARDHYTWHNELPPGLTTLNGVAVRRFPIKSGWNTPRYHALNARILLGHAMPLEEQYEWIDRGAHSPALYGFIDRNRSHFDLFIFIPYLFPTTYYGASLAPRQSILWPCLHDESHAWLHPTRLLLSSVRGVMYNSEPERRLAHRLGVVNPGEAVIGFGLAPEAGVAERFRQATGIEQPFVLYSGRLESAKNVPLLVRNFIEYKRERGGPLKLVLMGTGPEPGPQHADVIRLGFRQGQEKLDTYAAASLLCQPSVNESFSIVMMESWLARVPVLVHGNCAVTRYHVRQSRGGLYFSTFPEFAEALDLLQPTSPLRARLGQNGWRYVTHNYNWDAVAHRFEAALRQWGVAAPESLAMVGQG
jgi:glycosyltransferase involved in cell wall biosynthesis